MDELIFFSCTEFKSFFITTYDKISWYHYKNGNATRLIINAANFCKSWLTVNQIFYFNSFQMSE